MDGRGLHAGRGGAEKRNQEVAARNLIPTGNLSGMKIRHEAPRRGAPSAQPCSQARRRSRKPLIVQSPVYESGTHEIDSEYRKSASAAGAWLKSGYVAVVAV
ncbi:hypothetical protein KM043_002274 [Ampulex compressa]|nr:hypothetical protein KM043_002274 [Ampulex compressa]